jgi:catalase
MGAPKSIEAISAHRKWTLAVTQHILLTVGAIMDDRNIAAELVKALVHPEGSSELRPVHAIGIGATGHFVASDVAADYCVAEHFQGHKIPVNVRFSNGSGSANQHDGWSDVRGMATRFHLAGGAATDLIAMTLPEFFTPTPETFLEFAKWAYPTEYVRESPWRKILDMLRLTPPMRNPYPGEKISPDPGAIRFAGENRFAQLAVFDAASIGAPVSYARASYHAVHTFIVTAPDGIRRWVRFTWQPVAGVLSTDPRATPADKYLQEELRHRLRKGPARFSLLMSIGETGDDFNDPSRPWPSHRVEISMGTLTLDAVPDDQETYSERLSFNPWLLTDGIEPSDDPVLKVRKEAYEISSKNRHGTPCPFSRS